MEMFLSVLAISLIGVAVCAVLFVAATRPTQPFNLEPDERLLQIPSRFFADDRLGAGASPVVPIEVLLLQIERHVRLEQAAAEMFRDSPTAEVLHAPTTSPLVH